MVGEAVGCALWSSCNMKKGDSTDETKRNDEKIGNGRSADSRSGCGKSAECTGDGK